MCIVISHDILSVVDRATPFVKARMTYACKNKGGAQADRCVQWFPPLPSQLSPHERVSGKRFLRPQKATSPVPLPFVFMVSIDLFPRRYSLAHLLSCVPSSFAPKYGLAAVYLPQLFSNLGETHWTLLVNEVNRHVPEVTYVGRRIDRSMPTVSVYTSRLIIGWSLLCWSTFRQTSM